MHKVFINPGHSKNCVPDPGAVGNGYKEADIVLKISEALKVLLANQGIDCQIYQQCEGSTANAQLNKVPVVANKSGSDLFLSIHLNAGSSAAHGTETLYLSTSKNGKKFAELINAELTKPFGNYTLQNRGAKADVRGLLVLKATSMTAALTEICFISNANDMSFTMSHINDIAMRLCQAIMNYYGIQMKSEVSTIAQTFRLEPAENDTYNCYVDDELKLKNNKLSTCLDWIKKSYS